jgi:cell division protein FtsI (penicillin-binding protein 3)
VDARDRRRFVGRVYALFGTFAVFGALVGLRAAQLQLVQHAELEKLARSQYLDDLKLPARRGHIYDRNGEPVAVSVDVASVYANPTAVIDARAAARALAPVLDVPRDTLYQKLAADRLFVWLKRQVSPEIEQKIRSLGLAGINTTRESRRFYPHRELAAQVVGFTDLDSRGIEGVEKSFDEVLVGEPQVVAVERDARGRAVLGGDLDPERRTAGADVFLTLDLAIQHAAESALARAVQRTRAHAGMALVLDAASGDVLASAVWPPYNANVASTSSADVRRNRAFVDVFEPGSTMKPLVIAAALDSHAIRPDLTLYCENGSITIDGRTLHDSEPHGWLNLVGIIQKSSNICAAKIGAMLGRERLGAWFAAYGFGQKTGVTFPGEGTGLVRESSTWTDVGLATMSYGHGIAVTAIQMTAAYRALAMDGRWRAPRLIAAVRSPEGKRLDVPLAPERQLLSKTTTDRVRSMLEAAAGPGGTGELAALPGYRVAGKTGTALKPDLVAGGYDPKAYMAVFAGYVPAEAPRVVAMVALDEPLTQHTGGAVAAPVFAEIAAASLRVMGVGTPSAPVLAPPAPSSEALARASALEVVPREGPAVRPGSLPSFVGLTARQAVRRFEEVGTGLELELVGTGRVVRQDPPAGSERSRADHVTLVMAE